VPDDAEFAARLKEGIPLVAPEPLSSTVANPWHQKKSGCNNKVLIVLAQPVMVGAGAVLEVAVKEDLLQPLFPAAITIEQEEIGVPQLDTLILV
jgi:hypothetical protein